MPTLNLKNFLEGEGKRDEIENFLKECMNSKHPLEKCLPARMFMLAKEQHKREQKILRIENSISDRSVNVRKVILLNEDVAIIETSEQLRQEDSPNKIWYRIYFDGKVSSNLAESFEEALVMAICAMRGKFLNSDASELICKMLEIK